MTENKAHGYNRVDGSASN